METTEQELTRLRALTKTIPDRSQQRLVPVEDRLVESVYRTATRLMPEGRAACNHCGLESRTSGDRVINHIKGCELGLLFERAGGQVDFIRPITSGPHVSH
jgi:hypothetical protein